MSVPIPQVKPMDLNVDQTIQVWEKYEDVAVHFNDLIMRLRVQALSGVTAVLALSGVATNFAAGPIKAEQFDIVFGTIVFLIFAWISIGCLDLFYYRQLLLGAVEALLDIEKGTSIKLSTKIEEYFGKTRWTFGPWAFYIIGFVALASAACATKCLAVKAGRIEVAAKQVLQQASPTPVPLTPASNAITAPAAPVPAQSQP